MKRRVLLACPSLWDDLQLAGCRSRWADRYELVVRGAGAEEHPEGFDALTFIDDTLVELRDQRLHGVTSSSDYPGCVAAAVLAQELGLPAPSVQAVLTSSHKYYSRVA